MTLNITISDVKLSFLSITDTGVTGVALNADWVPLDGNGNEVALISQQKSAETKLFSLYPADVQAAILTLNNYAETRIKATYGI